MSSYFGLLDEVVTWLRNQNVEEAVARSYVAATFNALGSTAQARAADGFAKLVTDHSTPGGLLNEQAFRELKAAGWTTRIS